MEEMFANQNQIIQTITPIITITKTQFELSMSKKDQELKMIESENNMLRKEKEEYMKQRQDMLKLQKILKEEIKMLKKRNNNTMIREKKQENFEIDAMAIIKTPTQQEQKLNSELLITNQEEEDLLQFVKLRRKIQEMTQSAIQEKKVMTDELERVNEQLKDVKKQLKNCLRFAESRKKSYKKENKLLKKQNENYECIIKKYEQIRQTHALKETNCSDYNDAPQNIFLILY